LLGDANINIANFHLGRLSTRDASNAVALVEVDQVVPTEVLKAIAELPSANQVKLLHFA